MSFEMSPEIDKLAPALVKVQEATGGVEKNSSGQVGQQRYRYADLAATTAACRDALTENGFTVSQWPGLWAGNAMEMTTVLLHASGQWMRGTMSVPLTKQDAQGYGSAVTYARRYSLQAIVGLSPEDDDGIAASQRPAKQAGQAKQAEPEYAMPKDALDRLTALIRDSGVTSAALLKEYKVRDLRALDARQYQDAVDRLTAALAKKSKAETNAAQPADSFGELLEDEVPY